LQVLPQEANAVGSQYLICLKYFSYRKTLELKDQIILKRGELNILGFINLKAKSLWDSLYKTVSDQMSIYGSAMIPPLPLTAVPAESTTIPIITTTTTTTTTTSSSNSNNANNISGPAAAAASRRKQQLEEAKKEKAAKQQQKHQQEIATVLESEVQVKLFY
jgi:hypothetical protein